jgi:hypothetical protein
MKCTTNVAFRDGKASEEFRNIWARFTMCIGLNVILVLNARFMLEIEMKHVCAKIFMLKLRFKIPYTFSVNYFW